METNEKQRIFELMKIIMDHEGDIIKTNIMNDSALSLAYKMKDKQYYDLLISCFNSIDLLSDKFGRNLLTQMVIDKMDKVLTKTLDISLIKICHSEFLLNLGLKALKQNSTEIFKIILNHCNNRDVNLKNGETFLTNLLKNKEDISVIQDIVKSKYFNLNQINEQKESALMIACDQLNGTIVELLLQSGCDVAYNNYEAVQATMNAKSRSSATQNVEEIANKIMNMLMSPQKIQSATNICKSNNQIIYPNPAPTQLMYPNPAPTQLMYPNHAHTQAHTPCPAYSYSLFPHVAAPVKPELDLLKLLIVNKGNLIVENADKVTVLSKSYSYSDKSYFNELLENLNNVPRKLQIFSNDSGLEFLFKLCKESKWNILENILDKSEFNEYSNENLLKLAIQVLKSNCMKIYDKIIQLCFDPNTILSDGETFITNLFKNNINEEIIELVIKSEIFDITKPNKNNENPLILACSRLMTTLIPILLKQGCKISYLGYKAVVMTILANQTMKSEEIELKKNEILSLFFLHESRIEAAKIINKTKKTKNWKDEKSQICENFQLCIRSTNLYEEIRAMENSSKLNFVESVIVALFAKSDNLDILLYHEMQNRQTIKDILAWKIVYPLRKFGYVSHHMFEDLAKYYKEIDLYELDEISTFLSFFSKNKHFLSLISYQMEKCKSMELKLFIDLNTELDYITSEQLLNISMIQNKFLFEKIPSCLIIQAVKDSKSVFSYRNLIPLNKIEISRLVVDKFKKCIHCDSAAVFQCLLCTIRKALEISSGLFCKNHKCQHSEIMLLPNFNLKNKSKIFLNLSSIIYKRKLYYAALVKQKGSESIWSSYKIVEKGNETFSNLSYDKEISKFLQLNENEMKSYLLQKNITSIQLVLNKPHILIYENNALTCY